MAAIPADTAVFLYPVVAVDVAPAGVDEGLDAFEGGDAGEELAGDDGFWHGGGGHCCCGFRMRRL